MKLTKYEFNNTAEAQKFSKMLYKKGDQIQLTIPTTQNKSYTVRGICKKITSRGIASRITIKTASSEISAFLHNGIKVENLNLIAPRVLVK